MSGLGASYIYSDTVFKMYRAFQPRCEIFIKFCPAIAEILQHTDTKGIHLTQWHSEVTPGAWHYCCKMNLKHHFWKSETLIVRIQFKLATDSWYELRPLRSVSSFQFEWYSIFYWWAIFDFIQFIVPTFCLCKIKKIVAVHLEYSTFQT